MSKRIDTNQLDPISEPTKKPKFQSIDTANKNVHTTTTASTASVGHTHTHGRNIPMERAVVAHSVTEVTKRLSQVDSTPERSATSAKHKSRNTVGPWKLGKTLGKGSSGKVRLAKNMETGQLAAIKIVPKKKNQNQNERGRSHVSVALSDISHSIASTATSTEVHKAENKGELSTNLYGIEREIVIMKLVSHPNIMGLYEVWENKTDLFLVLEYVDGGELFDYLVAKGRLSEEEAVHYFRQIIEGVAFCHSFNICHRDLKPENLLLDKRNKLIKIADFGMAALELPDKLLETSCGSPHYASPEIVMGKPYHGGPSDIWSCGIILYALLSGHLPFNDNNIRHLLMKVQSGKYQMPPNLSPEARDLIERILVVNPEERITISEILAHPLLTKYEEQSQSDDSSSNTINPLEYISGAFSSIDLHLNSREDIDSSILSNLRILWHGAPREVLISKLLQRDMCEEKVFYFLLLQYKQKDFNSAVRESKDANARLQEPQRQPDTQLPSPSTYTGLSTTIESSETSDTLTTHRSVSNVAPSSSEVSVDSTADDTITSKEKLEVTETSEESAEKDDPNAPILTQKSQFSISSLLKAHGIAVSSSLSIRSQLTLPPRQREFVASSSRRLKRTTSFKSVDTAKSQRPQIPEHDVSIPNSSPSPSSSSSSLGRSPSGSSTDKMPLKMPVSRDSPEVVEDQFPRAEMPSDIDTKKSLYSLQSISKKSLNLNNFLSSSSTIPDTRMTSFTPPVEQRREFEMVCDQLLFGNTLDNILEEDEDSLTEPEMFNGDQSKQVALEQTPVGTRPPQLNKTEFSRLYHPYSSQKSGFVSTYQAHLRKPGYPDIVASAAITSDPIGGVYSPSVDRRLAEMEDAVDPGREGNTSPGSSGITLKVCTNPPPKTSNPKNGHHPPSSPLPVFSFTGTVTQQGIQQPEDTYSLPRKAYPAAISQRGSYRPGPIADSATEYFHAVDTNRFSSGTQQQSVPTRNRTLRMSSAPITKAVHVPFSLDPRRNVTEPSKLETLLRIVGKNTNPRKSRKTSYGYSSDDDDDEDDNDESEWNYTKGSIFNALDQTLKHFKEGLQVSYSQSKAFLAASDATTGIDDHSMTGALAQSSDIQDTVVSRQPSMLSQATSFANLNRFVTAQEEETQTDAESPVSPRRHESPQQSVSGNISFKRSPNQRKSLASFLGSKPRSSLIGSKTSSDMNLALFSDLTYVLDIPTKMSTAEMVELPHAGHRKQVASTTSEVLLDKVLENENESESESAQATGEQNQAEYAGDVGDANSFTSVSDRPSVMSTTDGVNIFEDAQSDTSSDLTDSDSNVRSHLQRKAISIDTLNTTNVIAPTTNVRISIYANDTNTDSNTPEKALPRETTEELIARFKLPENPMNRFQQKRFSKVDGNRLSEVLHSSESTSSKFEDLQEEGEQGAVRISKIDVSASKHPLNNLQRTKIIEGQLRRVTKMLEDESSPDSVGNLVDLIDKMTLKEKSLVDPSSGDSKARKSAVELPTTESSVTISKSPEIPQERALPLTPSPESHLLPEVEDVPAPEESNTDEYDGEQSVDLEDQPPSAAGSLSSNMGDEPKDFEKDNGKEVDSPVDANFEVLTSVPKQPWYIKLFESFRANSKRHSEEYVTKIPFDDLHLLALNAFGKNNVDYRLKNLDRRLGKEKVEYSCRFVGGNSKFKLKISCRDSNSIVTIKRKGKLDKTTDGTFAKFRRDVEQSIKGLESK